MMNMRSVGEVLTEARNASGLSIRQVSQTIKIRESLIESLEKGDYASFTSDMHLKSFLRSYASFLGINEEKIMALYRRERQIQTETTIKNTNRKPNRFSIVFSRFINLRGVFSLLTLSAVIIAVLFFYSQWKALNSPPRLEILSPKSGETLTSPNFVIEGFTGDPSIKVVLDSKEANYVDAELGKFKINAQFEEPGIKRFQVVAENQFNQKTIYSLDLKYEKPAEPTPTPSPTPLPVNNKLKLTNKLNREYKLTLLKDQKTGTYETVTLGAKKSADIEFKEFINIKGFDKNSVELLINTNTTPTITDLKEFTLEIKNNIPVIQALK